MGQKVNPHGLRVGVIQGWNAQWYASKKDFADFLVEDHKIREFIKRKYYTFGISKTTIDRAQGKVTVNIYTSKPGMLIGIKGAGVEQLKKELTKIVKKERTITSTFSKLKNRIWTLSSLPKTLRLKSKRELRSAER